MRRAVMFFLIASGISGIQSSCQETAHSSATTDANMTDTTKHAYTNALIHETSPYLLQHAHNPVDWMPWGDEALEKARKEDKMILISIGYSACHWCHVMEHESFENEAVAELMNEHFVCIKVDREERPDIDQIYMSAVQLMTGRGGWPLNCIALPDGRPIYGGTYFPKGEWKDVLGKLQKIYSEDRAKMEEQAAKVANGIKSSESLVKQDVKDSWDQTVVPDMVGKWRSQMDDREGGRKDPPKFPLPNNYEFLLSYAHLYQDQEVMNHVHLTLKKMAYGGIYDQIGGGFARYSTDGFWKVPHFEKMLYDNAQLMTLYAHAYQQKKDPLYRQVVGEIYNWLEREMTGPDGEFYSALDADSEGEEGKFYVWSIKELKAVLEEDYDLAKAYFNVNPYGEWEGHYIPLRRKDNAVLAEKFDLSPEDFEQRISGIKATLLEKRAERVRPGLDDKALTSWNMLMSKGLLDAYMVFGEEKYYQAAVKNVKFFLSSVSRKDGGLNHNYKAGKTTINGYLEDYCFAIEALIRLYEADGNENWLKDAEAFGRLHLFQFL